MKFKKGLFTLSLFFIMGMITGCSHEAFYFDFTRFILNEEVEKEVKLEGLNLKNDIISKNDILKIDKIITSTFEVLANKDYYYNNFNNPSNYFNKVKDNLTTDFYNALSSGKLKSAIKKSIDNIYYNEYTEFKEAKLISVEKTLYGITCYVEVVSVNDSLLFNSETISLDLDSKFRIKGDNTISAMSSETNTINELNEDSLLQTNHNDFIKSLKKLFKNLSNEKLYNEVITNNSSKTEFALDTLINNIQLKNKNNDSLTQLFLAGKGTFSNYAIDSYKINDYDNMAITTYVVKFSVKGEVQKFEIEYSRILKDIIKVKNQN